MRASHIGTLVALLATSACSGPDAMTPTAPTSSGATPQPSTSADPRVGLANWSGDATVLSRTGGGGCGWGTNVGEERQGVSWRVTLAGESVLLDEDMSNWPTDHIGFSGTLDGKDFTADYFQGDDYAGWVCAFREAHLVGHFSADFSTFEAMETLIWGVPGQETVVRRRWTASRM